MSANIYNALDEAKSKYFSYHQQIEATNTKHVKTIKDLVATIEHYGGSISNDEGLLEYEKRKDGNVTTSKDYNAIVKEKVIAVAVIKRSNPERFKNLIKDIRAQHSYGQDLYPATVEIAHNMLNKHELLNKHDKRNSNGTRQAKPDDKGNGARSGERGNRFGYAQQYAQREVVPGDDGRVFPHVTCFECRKKGHYSDHCPNMTNGESNANKHENMQQM